MAAEVISVIVIENVPWANGAPEGACSSRSSPRRRDTVRLARGR